jgi:hypothetical protein
MDFLNRFFSGESAKNRVFRGVEKIKAAPVYHFYFNYSAMQGKFNTRSFVVPVNLQAASEARGIRFGRRRP